MPLNGTLIASTNHTALEHALRAKLELRAESAQLGLLAQLGVRIGLIQHSLKPTFKDPQLLVIAGDHGLVVDAMAPPSITTRQSVGSLLEGRSILPILANANGLNLSVIDAGLSDLTPHHPHLALRKIAHGTRNCRLGDAMTIDQAHAAIRAGMEIADALPGNVVACAGMGVGNHLSSALVIGQLAGVDVLRLGWRVDAGPEDLGRAASVLRVAQHRHQHLHDPVEIVAAMGGFETAMLVGVMLVAASKRNLIVIDGLNACAALMVATMIAPTVKDYCVFCRSHSHPGLQEALRVLGAKDFVLDLDFEGPDGCGAALAWPMIQSAAAVLAHVNDDEDAHRAPFNSVERLPPETCGWAGSRFSASH